MLAINFLAVIVAAAASFVIGFLLHGPVSGKLWMRLANIQPTGNEKMSDMYGKMFWNFVVNLVTAYGIALLYLLSSASPLMSGSAVWNGIVCALIAWFAFVATSTSIEVIWMEKSFKLWLFEFFASLIAMSVIGAIIGAWQ